MRLTIAILPLLLISCGGTPSPIEARPSDAGADADAAPLAEQTLQLSKVVINQSVAVPLLVDGVAVTTRNAPVVANRDALLRVHVKPGKGWVRKRMRATFVLQTNTGKLELADERDVGTLGSSDGDLESTFHFDIPKAKVLVNATWTVSIVEKATGAVFARWPAEDGLPAEKLGAAKTGNLKIVLVPVRYDFDGSGRLPDTSEEAIQATRDMMFRMYPVEDVEVTVRSEPFPFANEITAMGPGWEQLLDAIIDLRAQDAPAKDVYYYGLFKPKERFYEYCREGCTLGLSNLVTSATDAFMRGSIGIGYGGEQSAETLAHEVGHAHGRAHAPCGGPRGIDGRFPYENGEIGVWGWDSATKTLIDPEHTDLMGYCQPVHVSDYTYNRLAMRITTVNNSAYMFGGDATPRAYRLVHVAGDGSLSWGRMITSKDKPESEPRTVTYETETGQKTTVTGFWYASGDRPGGTLVVPDERAAVRLHIETIPLATQKVIELPRP